MGKNLVIGLSSAAASLIAGGEASAVYTGLTMSLHSIVNITGTNRCVFRLYANFSTSTDYLTGVAGSDGVGNMVIESRNSNGTGAGGNFYNPGSLNGAPTAL